MGVWWFLAESGEVAELVSDDGRKSYHKAWKEIGIIRFHNVPEIDGYTETEEIRGTGSDPARGRPED